MTKKTAAIYMVIACFAITSRCVWSQSFGESGLSAGGVIPSLSQPSTSDLICMPGLVSHAFRSGVATAWSRAYDMKELDRLSVSTSMVSSLGSLSFGFEQLGSADLFKEESGRVVISRDFGDVSGGLLCKASRVSFAGGYSPLTKISLGCGLSMEMSSLSLALAGYDLNTPAYSHESVEDSPHGVMALEYRGKSDVALSATFRFEGGTRPRFGLGQRLALSGGESIHLGAMTLPLEYSAGLQMKREETMISYTARYHADLGITHFVLLGYEWGRGEKEE